MSTKATLIYIEDKGFHVYHELLDNTVHVEIEKPGMVVDVEIMPFDQWVLLDLPTGIVSSGLTPRAADDCPECGGWGEVARGMKLKINCGACGGKGGEG